MKPLAEQTYYELLDVPSDASADCIEQAFEKATQFYGPESLATYTLADGDESKRLLDRIEEAYLTLSDAALRRAYDDEIGLGACAAMPAAGSMAAADSDPLAFPAILEAVHDLPWPGSCPEDERDAVSPPSSVETAPSPAVRAFIETAASAPEPGAPATSAASAAFAAAELPTANAETAEAAAQSQPAQLAAPALAPAATASPPPVPDLTATAPQVACLAAGPAASAPQPDEAADLMPVPAPLQPSEPPASTASAAAIEVAVVVRPSLQPPAAPQPAAAPGRTASEPVAEQPAEAGPPKVEEPKPAARPLPRMPEIPPNAVFNGELLRRVREGRGVSVRELSDRTKVGLTHLENIEADRYEALPIPVYLRGFLMLIARELKLDPLKVSKSFLEQASREGGKKPG